MNRIDVAKMRADLVRLMRDEAQGASVSNALAGMLEGALDEIEALRKPAAGVTDAQVEEAAKIAWRVPTAGHRLNSRAWEDGSDIERATQRNEARAVLEYAATLAPTVPAVDPRAERLVKYRCAAPQVMLAMGGGFEQFNDAQIAARVEDIAHAMLATEREPTDAV